MKTIKEVLNMQDAQIIPLSGGTYNQTFRLKNQEHDYVIRIEPENKDRITYYEKQLMAQEACAHQILQDHFQSDPLLIQSEFKVEKLPDGRLFSYSPYIDSIPFSQQVWEEPGKSDLETIDKIYQQLVPQVKKIHTLTNPQKEKAFGYVLDVAKGQGYDTWYEHIYTIAKRIIIEDQLTWIDHPEKILDCFKQNKDIINEITTPHFIHGDLWAANVLIKGDKLCALIDLDRAQWADPLYEFAMGWFDVPNFWHYWGQELTLEKLQGNDLTRLRIYRILMALKHARSLEIQYQDLKAGQNYQKTLFEQVYILEENA